MAQELTPEELQALFLSTQEEVSSHENDSGKEKSNRYLSEFQFESLKSFFKTLAEGLEKIAQECFSVEVIQIYESCAEEPKNLALESFKDQGMIQWKVGEGRFWQIILSRMRLRESVPKVWQTALMSVFQNPVSGEIFDHPEFSEGDENLFTVKFSLPYQKNEPVTLVLTLSEAYRFCRELVE